MNPNKTTHAPKVTTKRTQRTLHAAIERARSAQDKAKVTHLENVLNGQTLLPPQPKVEA